MENSSHIFIQVDTAGLIQIAGEILPNSQQVSEHAYIFDQGSMALGKPEKTFSIDVVPGKEIYFTILPLQLFSKNKLYFTRFEVTYTNGLITFSKDQMPSIDGHQISFKMTIDKAETGGELSFALHGVVEYRVPVGEIISIPITIDPVMRVKQGKP